MKVLRVSAGLDSRFGGPSVSAVNSCIAVARAGADVTVLFPYRRVDAAHACAIADRLRAEHAAVETFPFARMFERRAWRWGVSFAMVRRLFAAAREHDVVHAHGGWTFSALVALVAAAVRRRPFVLTPHEALSDLDVAKSRLPARLVKRAVRRLYVARATLIVVASEYEAETSLPAGRGRVAVVPHAVFDDRRTEGFVDADSGGDGVRIGYLGRFDPKKNIELLIDAVALVDGAVLQLAGSGDNPSPEALRERVERLGLRDRVELLGWLQTSELRVFFARIDVLAMLSTHECFGMAAAEALAAGVPVLVSPNTGLAGLVVRRSCGSVVEPVVEKIAQELRRLARDRAVLQEQSVRARDAAIDELSFSAHGRAMLESYAALRAPMRETADRSLGSVAP